MHNIAGMSFVKCVRLILPECMMHRQKIEIRKMTA